MMMMPRYAISLMPFSLAFFAAIMLPGCHIDISLDS